MDQLNALTSAELKRRGIAAIEQALQHGLAANPGTTTISSRTPCKSMTIPRPA